MTATSEPAVLLGQLRRQQFYILAMDMITPAEDPLSVLGPHLEEHLDWLRAREQDGSMFLSGARADEVGWDGSGLAIMRGESRRAVEELAETEPFHRAGLRKNTVTGWQLNEGNVRLRLKVMENTFEIS